MSYCLMCSAQTLQQFVTETLTWLEGIAKRFLWRPCFGDVSIVKSEMSVAEGLLVEARTHDDVVKQLADDVDFVVEHSKPGKRKQMKKDITVSILFSTGGN